MCLFFFDFYYVSNFYIKKKKRCRCSSEVVQWKSKVLCGWVKKYIYINEGLLMKLSVTVVCDALLIWPVLLSECKKKKKRKKNWRDLESEWRIWGSRVLEGGLSEDLSLLSFHSSIVLSVLWFFFWCFFGREMSLLIQVVWAGACARLQRTNGSCTLMGRLWPN